MRRGMPSRCTIAVAATASGGERIAPSVKATAQGRPSAACATTPTTVVVASTRPSASSAIGRRLARKSRTEVKKAAEKRIGGRKSSRTISESSATRGRPGTNPSASPPRTSRIGYGNPSRRAIVTSAATATSNPRISSNSCIAAQPLVKPDPPPGRPQPPQTAASSRGGGSVARRIR